MDEQIDTEPAGAWPVGTWSERLVLERGTYSSTLRFTANGRALILVGPRPGCLGTGTWTATGPRSFRFRITELVFDADGVYEGWVDIDQQAIQDGDTFVSTGRSDVFDTDDTLLESVDARTEAVRVRSAVGDGSHVHAVPARHSGAEPSREPAVRAEDRAGRPVEAVPR